VNETVMHPQAADKGLNLIIYPGDLQGASRVGKIAKSLQSTGDFVETHAVGKTGISQLPEYEDLSPGVKLVRVKDTTFNGPAGWTLGQLLWPGRVIRRYRRQKVAAVSAQRAFALPVAYHLSRRTGAIFAYNAHELETEVLGFSGLKQKIAKFIEKRYNKHTDVVSVVNDSIADWYADAYPGLRRPTVLTNTPIDDGKSVDLRSKFGIPDDALVYIHIGFITDGRNVPLMLREFAAHPEAHVIFLGDGHMRKAVVEAGQTNPNIHWHPPVDPDSVVAHVRGADIGLCLIEYASLSDELSTPNKLMEALSAGIPPLSSGLFEARRLIGPEASKTWILDSPEEQLAGALERITRADVDEFKKHWGGIPGWDAQAQDLIDAYREAITAKRSRKRGRKK